VPTKYSHPHRYDNVNFPEQEYIDFFGGTKGEGELKEREHYKLDLSQNSSGAIKEHNSTARTTRLANLAKDLDKLNEQEAK